MSITPEILRKLSIVKLSAKQMAAVLEVIADVVGEYKIHENEIIAGYQRVIEGHQQREEEKKKRDADRKRKSRECPRTVTGQSQDSHSDMDVTVTGKVSPLDVPPLVSPTPPLEHPPLIPPANCSTNAGASFDKSRLQMDLPDDWYADCQLEMGWKHEVIMDVWVNFGSHWRGKVGGTAFKTQDEWRAQWHSWYRGQNIKNNGKVNGGTNDGRNGKSKLEVAAEGFQRAAAKREQASAGQAG